MTQKRMFHRDVLECNAFTELPHRTQLFYIHLCFNADDDGFVDKVRLLMRSWKCQKSDVDLLVKNGFLIYFSTGLFLIRHWRKHNAKAKNHTPTIYQKEFDTVFLDDRKTYQENSEKNPPEKRKEEKRREENEKEVEREKADATAADGISSEVTSDPCPTTTAAQEKEAEKKSPSDSGEVTFQPPTREEVEAYAKAEGLIHVDIGRFFDYYDGSGWRTPKGHPVNWRFKLRNWERDDAKDAEKAEQEQPSSGSFDTDDFFNAALARSYQSMET